jgi:hypothetical protein
MPISLICPCCGSPVLLMGAAHVSTDIYNAELAVTLDFGCRAPGCGEYSRLRLTAEAGVPVEGTWEVLPPTEPEFEPEPEEPLDDANVQDPFDAAVAILREVYSSGGAAAVAALLKRYGVKRVLDIPRTEGRRLLALAKALAAFGQSGQPDHPATS